MPNHEPHDALADNLCTKILSCDQYEPKTPSLVFEPNLSSVWCREGHALSVKERRCTAVTSTLFGRDDRFPDIEIELEKCNMGKPMAVGIVSEKPFHHGQAVIGDFGYPAFGVEIVYAPGRFREASPSLRVRSVDGQTHEHNTYATDRSRFTNFESVRPRRNDTISIRVEKDSLVFLLNDHKVHGVSLSMPRKYRIGVSFTSTKQEVFITTPTQRGKQAVDPFDEKFLLSLPQTPIGQSQQYAFVSTSPELLISDNSILCTSDIVRTAVTAEIFAVRQWKNAACQGCGAEPIVSNKWQCMECEDFDLCQKCFDRFLADEQKNLFHPHQPEGFTCALGGERHEMVVRIDDFDDDGAPMFFGIVPKLFVPNDFPVGSLKASYALQVSKSISVLSQGTEKEVPWDRSVRSGDRVHVLFTGQCVQFSINGMPIAQTPASLEDYRFAVTLQRSNQAVSIVDGNLATSIPRGTLIDVDASKALLQENCIKCSIAPSYEVLGETGVVVDADDSDGTVGVGFGSAFKWIPRVCCQLKKASRKYTKSFRQAIALPYEGDTVTLQPCEVDGWSQTNGGISGVVVRGDVVRHDEEQRVGANAPVFPNEPCPNRVHYEIQWQNDSPSRPNHSRSIHAVIPETIGNLLVRIEKHAQVVRNPYFWRWGSQDGDTIYSPSRSRNAVEFLGWALGIPENGWVTVYWEKTRICEKYRWGCDNAFDVACVRRSSDSGYKEIPYTDLSSDREPHNPERYSSFIKECHFIPMNALRFSQTASDELGRGRFGTVYRGVWGDIDVAIKEISHPDIYQARDLGVLSRIAHPNAIRIHGWSAKEHESLTIYLVMELVTPGSLAKVIRDLPPSPAHAGGALGWENFFHVAIGVAHALHYFARQGLVHRDIKPENILLSLTDGAYSVRVTDFGLAKFIPREESADLTNVCGTPAYMSPEAWDTGKKISAKADVFSLGLVMYSMLTGRTPRSNCENAFQILYDLVTAKKIVQPPEETPEGLCALIADCQSLDPEGRPSAMEVIQRLHAAQLEVRENQVDNEDSPISSEFEELNLTPPGAQKRAESSDSPVNSLVHRRAKAHPIDTLRRPRNAAVSAPTRGEVILAPPSPSYMHGVTFEDLTEELHFTPESAEILLRLPELAQLQLPETDTLFTIEKRRLVLHEAIDQFLISVKLIALQTKLNYEFLFSLIAKANIPLLVKRSFEGVKMYFVLLKHYSRFINLTSSKGVPKRPTSPRKPTSGSSLDASVAARSLPQDNAIRPPQQPNLIMGRAGHHHPAEISPSKASRYHSAAEGRVQNTRAEPPMMKAPFPAKYLSFKNFCVFADISWLSLMALINAEIIMPKRIFGQTFRISCDQKDFLHDCILPIEKFQANCALTASEIRAFAIVLQVPVLYRPKVRTFCLLFDDINDRIMPEIEHAAQVSSRAEFIAFLGISRKDVVALEERDIIARYLSFERLKIFEHIALIMNRVVPLAIARQEMQHLLDLSPAEFDDMLDEYIETGAMYGQLHMKGESYLFKEEIQYLMQVFSQSE